MKVVQAEFLSLDVVNVQHFMLL
uniref:Uncharacterized protein n=1 Tax=Solanum lycopersicum TaxID=4081 RepID=A0A3Q7G5J0_SOLLC